MDLQVYLEVMLMAMILTYSITTGGSDITAELTGSDNQVTFSAPANYNGSEEFHCISVSDALVYIDSQSIYCSCKCC